MLRQEMDSMWHAHTTKTTTNREKTTDDDGGARGGAQLYRFTLMWALVMKITNEIKFMNLVSRHYH